MFDFLRQKIPENFFLWRFFSATKAFFAALFYGFPAQKLKIIGVTGTDGKTTTTQMLAHLLRKNGKRVLSISTAEIKMNDKILTADKRTTPSPWNLQKWLAKAAKKNIEVVILEVSSHAIAQNRIFGISFEVSVLTNISPEHLDYHKTLSEYANTKKNLFTRFLRKKGTAVLNIDDDFGHQWAKKLPKVKTYSQKNPKADLFVEKISPTSNGICFFVNGKKVFMPIFGQFNAENAAAAILGAECFELSREKMLIDLGFFRGVPGRMEKISTNTDFDVFLNFALTPLALEKMIKSLREMKKRIILVFGMCGTHPDPHIRAEMGRVSSMADVIIVTDDEPYFENPQKIRREILIGAQKNLSDEDFSEKFLEIADRRAAIETALQKAGKNDVVVVNGMGHLSSRNINGKEISWSDRKIILNILNQ